MAKGDANQANRQRDPGAGDDTAEDRADLSGRLLRADPDLQEARGRGVGRRRALRRVSAGRMFCPIGWTNRPEPSFHH